MRNCREGIVDSVSFLCCIAIIVYDATLGVVSLRNSTARNCINTSSYKLFKLFQILCRAMQHSTRPFSLSESLSTFLNQTFFWEIILYFTHGFGKEAYSELNPTANLFKIDFLSRRFWKKTSLITMSLGDGNEGKCLYRTVLSWAYCPVSRNKKTYLTWKNTYNF